MIGLGSGAHARPPLPATNALAEIDVAQTRRRALIRADGPRLRGAAVQRGGREDERRIELLGERRAVRGDQLDESVIGTVRVGLGASVEASDPDERGDHEDTHAPSVHCRSCLRNTRRARRPRSSAVVEAATGRRATLDGRGGPTAADFHVAGTPSAGQYPPVRSVSLSLLLASSLVSTVGAHLDSDAGASDEVVAATASTDVVPATHPRGVARAAVTPTIIARLPGIMAPIGGLDGAGAAAPPSPWWVRWRALLRAGSDGATGP